MKLTPLEPFGLRLEKLHLARGLSQPEANEIKRLLADHGVLVISDQTDLDDQGFVSVLKTLGSLTFTEGETPVEGTPELNLVTNVGRTRKPRSVFHTDTSYVADTPAYTALRVVDVPEEGGETLFSNQNTAWQSLPAPAKLRLDGLKVLHQVTGLNAEDLGETETWHDLVRVHPISERPALFLSTPERCVALSSFPPETGRRWIETLYRFSTRPRLILRHRWKAGDIVIWDNRCTMHRADHSAVIGNRTMHRGMVAA